MWSYDLSTNEGKVRLLIADSRDDGHIYEDEELTTFLVLNAANVRLAAADALETMASNESLVQKKIRLLDVQTDGPAVAADLRKAAANLRALANAAIIKLGDLEPGFAVAEFPQGIFAEGEYLLNEIRRGAA